MPSKEAPATPTSSQQSAARNRFKAAGAAAGGNKRHALTTKQKEARRLEMMGLPRPALMRLACKGRTLRVGGDAYLAIRIAHETILSKVLHDVLVHTDAAHRLTVTEEDVRQGCKRNGITLVGRERLQDNKRKPARAAPASAAAKA